MNSRQPLPLSGLRILEVANFLPGPFAGLLLADLGAEVIKIEPPGGDPARHLIDGIFGAANRNKRAVQWDLKSESARQDFLRLAVGADVIIEGHRPGAMDRLNLGYSIMSQANPGVIYCSISGYGQFGPKSANAGHDINFLADSGGLWFSPHVGERARRSGVPIADLAGSSFAAMSILAALRKRDVTGEGCHLDVAIADALFSFVSPRAGPDFEGSAHPDGIAFPVNDLFETNDRRLIAISAVEPKFWANLRAVMESFDPRIADARFDTHEARRTHAVELKALLDEIVATQTSSHWMEVLGRADVPCSLVRSPLEAARDEHVVQRGIVQTSPQGRTFVAFPVLVNGVPMGAQVDDPPALSSLGADIAWTS